MDSDLIITLLTIAVIILSAVVVAALAVITALLVRVQRIVKSLDKVLTNLSVATEWLTPSKVFRSFFNQMRK